jgi:hypothetical protein
MATIIYSASYIDLAIVQLLPYTLKITSTFSPESLMSIEQFITQLRQQPDAITFKQTIEVITQNFNYAPTQFSNGPDIINEAGSNEGSCKIFAFAQHNQLNQDETLACFGEIYRDEVLALPEADNHGNIRAFMATGWDGIKFESAALSQK